MDMETPLRCTGWRLMSSHAKFFIPWNAWREEIKCSSASAERECSSMGGEKQANSKGLCAMPSVMFSKSQCTKKVSFISMNK
jgi:hypothetical protein